MDEILPGIHHWTATHPNIGAPVSSYYVESAAAVIDPMPPDVQLDWFDGRPLERVILSNRHHDRSGAEFAERFAIPVLVNENGLHEVQDLPNVQTFAFGDEVAPGVTVHGVLASWPDEGVLHIAHGSGALAIADSAMRYGGQMSFVPDQYIGDDPEAAKAELRDGLRGLLDLDFDALLFAHGEPLPSGGKEALRAFVNG